MSHNGSCWVYDNGFRLTIRNVNLLKSYILVLKATGFRLTIRNVNIRNSQVGDILDIVLD